MKTEFDEQTQQRIQEEIAAKVFEKYAQQEGQQNQKNEMNANLEALQDVTNLPLEEIEAIANEVTNKHLSKSRKQENNTSTPIALQAIFFDEMEEKVQKERRQFYPHAIAYAMVNTMLITLNIITSPHFPWAMFPFLGWGIGLVTHYFKGVRHPAEDLKKNRKLLETDLEFILEENIPSYELNRSKIYNGCYRMLTGGLDQDSLTDFVIKVADVNYNTAAQTSLQMARLRTSIVGEPKKNNLEKLADVVDIFRGERKTKKRWH